ncbi:class F sortase, partial [Arthrobacter sp. Br18]|uniref:class F sortase n=1 Tax=Arthrobacter sp. Br18 TaxID=1312954 RepID=UPI0012DDF11E
MSPRHPRVTVLLLAASLGLLAGGCGQPETAPQQAVPVPSAAQITADEALGAPAPITLGAPAPEAPAPTTPGAPAPGGAPGITVRPATAAQGEDVPLPVSLDIEGTDIAVDVVDVGMASDAEMEIPDSFYEAGWYRYGSAPGASSGNAVLAAHIDVGTEVMPFAQLKNVSLGTIVTGGR